MLAQGVVFGLRLRSDFLFPEAPEGAFEADVPVEVVRGRVSPPGFAEVQDAWVYGSRGDLHLEAWRDRIRVVCGPNTAESTVRLVVYGTGLAMVWTRRGSPVLHGTTLRVGKEDWLVCGESGVGKSSFTMEAVEAGAQLVADDVAVLDRSGCVRLGLARTKLWEDGVRHYFGSPSGFERVHPEFDKYSVPMTRVDEARPLSRIVLLERGEGVSRLSKSDAHFELLAQHRVPALLGPAARGRWMTQTASVARTVPVYRVGLPGPLSALRPLVNGLAEGRWGNG